MRWVLGLVLVFVLLACSSPETALDERPDVWVGSVSGVNNSQFTYRIIECADTNLFSGAFIPFEVSVDERSRLVDEYEFEPYNDSCVSIDYALESEFHEDLLGSGALVVRIDPRDTINESDERNNRYEYAPQSVCIDADGDNPFLSSFVTARTDGESIYLLDRCENATATEFTCDGSGLIAPIAYNCSDGCVSGSCRCLNSGTCLTDGSATRI